LKSRRLIAHLPPKKRLAAFGQPFVQCGIIVSIPPSIQALPEARLIFAFPHKPNLKFIFHPLIDPSKRVDAKFIVKMRGMIHCLLLDSPPPILPLPNKLFSLLSPSQSQLMNGQALLLLTFSIQFGFLSI
jgi:hypothetical protein